jgi:hypothetical protein
VFGTPTEIELNEIGIRSPSSSYMGMGYNLRSVDERLDRLEEK